MTPHNPGGALEPARPILLLTRPEAASERFRGAFHARFGDDWPVVISPLLKIEALRPTLPARGARTLVFTSENAVNTYAALTAGRGPVAWCVGQRTAEAASAAGFVTRTGPGDAAALIQSLQAAGVAAPVLVPRGVHTALDIAARLNSAGIETDSVVVYDQKECPATAAARRALGGTVPVVLPLFSPRSAVLAAQACDRAKAPLRIAAISPAAAKAFTAPFERCETAKAPTQEGVLAALSPLLATA